MGVLPKQGIANVYKEKTHPFCRDPSNWIPVPRWSPWRSAKDLPIIVEKPAASEVMIGGGNYGAATCGKLAATCPGRITSRT